ncbi:MAG: hypothetical protein ACYDHN_01770 [Solirubrobacteraceae bacterium]
MDSSNMALVGASSDFSVVYFEYYGTLVPEDAPRQPVVAGGNTQAWGLYEWREGRLKAAGLLPSGEEDPDGVEAAAIGENFLNVNGSDFDNQVSASGNTALFVSPAPEAQKARAPQLYARLDGKTTVLISRSDITGQPSLKGPAAVNGLGEGHAGSFAFGSPDGSRVFFASEEQLTSEAPADTSLKEYQYDVTAGTLTYLPGVTAPILASSSDGSTLAFDDTSSHKNKLAIFANHQITDITPLPNPTEEGVPSEEELYVAPVRLAGSTLVFQTDSPIVGFNNGNEDLSQVYRYDPSTDGLSCVSCPPPGQLPQGAANLSNNDFHHLTHLVVDDRGVSEDGSEIFFDTPDALVPEDQNGVRDVYEWHNGRISLISAGTGSDASFLLDNSASGDDVFFATKDNLLGADTDGSYDVYDARVGGGFPAVSSTSSCSGGCHPTSAGISSLSSLITSASLLGAGEQVPAFHPSKHALSRAQKLRRGLRACRRKHGMQRRSCEVRARRRYGRRVAHKRS